MAKDAATIIRNLHGSLAAWVEIADEEDRREHDEQALADASAWLQENGPDEPVFEPSMSVDEAKDWVRSFGPTVGTFAIEPDGRLRHVTTSQEAQLVVGQKALIDDWLATNQRNVQVILL